MQNTIFRDAVTHVLLDPRPGHADLSGLFGRRVFGVLQVKLFPRINSKARASEPLDGRDGATDAGPLASAQ